MKYLILIIACISISFSESLIGTWENELIIVNYNSDSTNIQVIKAEEFPQKLGVKPIRTTYFPNGKYHSLYFTPQDSLISKVSGLWHEEGDSLYLIQLKPVSKIFKYEYKLVGNKSEFSTITNFDGDSLDNDAYYGLQKKVQSRQSDMAEIKVKKYIFVEIQSGPTRNQLPKKVEEINLDHLKYISKLTQDGIILVSGLISDDMETKGTYIMNLDTKEEAISYLQNDPAYIAGRIKFKIHEWYTQQGIIIR